MNHIGHYSQIYQCFFIHFREVSRLTIRAGSSFKGLGGSTYKIRRVIRHEKYRAGITDYDFALLELYKPLTFTKAIQPIALPNEDTVVEGGRQSLVSGWGLVHSPSEAKDQLRVAYFRIANQKYCNEIYQRFGLPITDRAICAGYVEEEKDSCQGEPGDPLSIEKDDGQRILIGIVSWGHLCAKPNHPRVYARVTTARVWIKTETGV